MTVPPGEPTNEPGGFTLWPTATVELPGATLAYRHVDDARPAGAPARDVAVMVHGLGGAATNWTDLMGLLRDRLDTYAPDLPGFGDSPPPDDGDFTPRGHVRHVTAFIEHLQRQTGCGPVHLLGNSMGGTISLLLASTRPDLVRTLTLVAPAMPDLVPSAGRTQVLTMALPLVGNRLAGLVTELPAERRLDGLIRLCYADPANVSAESYQLALGEIRRRQGLPYAADALSASTKGLVKALLQNGTKPLWQAARHVVAPTLLVYGAQDKLVSPRTGRRLAQTIPSAHLVLLPGSGHVPQMEHPHVVADLVRAHLDRSEQQLAADQGVVDARVTAFREREAAGLPPARTTP